MSDMEESDVTESGAPAGTAPDPVVVIASQPSSASPTQASEAVEAEAPQSIEDAVRTLIGFLRGHRTIGDSDVDAAVAAVEAALAQNA